MNMMPFQVLGIWFRGLLTLAIIGASAALLYAWQTQRHTQVVEAPARAIPAAPSNPNRVAPNPPADEVQVKQIDWQFGLNAPTAYLVGGLALATWALGGRWLRPKLYLRPAGKEPATPSSKTVQYLQRPDGTRLHVELYGPEDRPAVIFTHGWSLNVREWNYAVQELAGQFRVVVWDLPGLGRSSSPKNKSFSLEKMARDLEAVLGLAGDQPTFLVGHSIGGMILLKFCRLFPEELGRRVKGLVLANTTYTNPVKTTSWAGLYTAIQKPILEPLCHLMIWFAPLVWLLNWASYLNGSLHNSTEKCSFSGRETRGQLNFFSRMCAVSWPAVVGRGMLAMFRFEAADVLDKINVPALVLTASGDQTCVPEASQLMSRTMPQAKLVNFDSARHCGQFEFHQSFAQLLAEFVTSRTLLGTKKVG